MDGLAAHSALKEQMRLSSAVAFSPALQESIALQMQAMERARAATLPTLRMPEIPSSLAFMADLQRRAAIDAGNAMKAQAMLIPSSITQAIQSLAAHRNSLEAAYAAVRENPALFSQSSEMLRAVREGVAALRAVEAARPPSLTTVLRGIRLDQPRFNNIVEGLATAAITDLGPEEARGVATAFEESVAAQAMAGPVSGDVAGIAADQIALEEFSERLQEAVLAKLSPQAAGGSSIINLHRLIAILAFLLALATYQSGIEAAKSDRKNTQEITSRQDESNELLRRLLEECQRHSTKSVPRMRLVDRDARLFQRPVKGSPVIAVVPEGVQVAVVDVWGRWVEITYMDAASEVTRTGWLLKKYLE